MKFFGKINKLVKKLREWENPFYEESDEDRDEFELWVGTQLLAFAIFICLCSAIYQWNWEALKVSAFWIIYGSGAYYLLAARPFEKKHGYYPWQKKKG